jgi:GTPase SAR1 family protein
MLPKTMKETFPGTRVVVYLYSITSLDSFLYVERLDDEVNKLYGESVIKFLVGHKCDLELERTVSKEYAE